VHHVNECHNSVSTADAQILIDECIAETEATSLDRFRTKEFGSSHKNKFSHLSGALVALYQANKHRFTYGKKALGLLKSKLHTLLKQSSDIEKPTKAVKNAQLSKIAIEIWTT
jgi:hypothetical protein